MDLSKFQVPIYKSAFGFCCTLLGQGVMNKWPNEDLLSYCLFGAAGLLFLWTAYDVIFIFLRWKIHNWRVLIPLTVASQKAYDALRDTTWHHIAERLIANGDSDPKKALTSYARMIGDDKPLYGSEPASPKIRLITDSQRLSPWIINHGEYLKRGSTDYNLFENLMVEKRHLKEFIKERTRT